MNIIYNIYMPNYTFTLEFKDKIQLFFNPSLLSDIEKA